MPWIPGVGYYKDKKKINVISDIRYFNGKKFNLVHSLYNKGEAEKLKDWYKKNGNNVRIIKGNYKNYLIYIR